MKQQSFEIALHKWSPWLNSVTKARKTFSKSGLDHPSLDKMKKAARSALKRLKFPQCTLLEVYWLACIFSDYATETGFKFEELKLPDWFPLPYGFKDEENIDKHFLDLKGGRIKPPVIWEVADVTFWQTKDPMFRFTGHLPDYILNTDFIIVLPPFHPVRKYVSMGRPRKLSPNGELPLAHPSMKLKEPAKKPQGAPAVPVNPVICPHCGGASLMLDKEDGLLMCLLCGRSMPLN